MGVIDRVVCRLTLFWCHKEGENRTIKVMLDGTIRNDDFFAQYSVVMLEQGCNHSEQCRNNVEMI